jgi:hypothetical protein
MSTPWTPVSPGLSPWVPVSNNPEWWDDSSTLTFEATGGEVDFVTNEGQAVQFTATSAPSNPWTPVSD